MVDFFSGLSSEDWEDYITRVLRATEHYRDLAALLEQLEHQQAATPPIAETAQD